MTPFAKALSIGFHVQNKQIFYLPLKKYNMFLKLTKSTKSENAIFGLISRYAFQPVRNHRCNATIRLQSSRDTITQLLRWTFVKDQLQKKWSSKVKSLFWKKIKNLTFLYLECMFFHQTKLLCFFNTNVRKCRDICRQWGRSLTFLRWSHGE